MKPTIGSMLFQSASWVCAFLLTPMAWHVLAAPSVGHWHTGSRILEARGLFEGDIVLPEGNSEDRAAVPEAAKLWPRAVIPYTIHKNIGGRARAIKSAMESIEAVSCLRFVNRTKDDFDYVLIYSGSECSSLIGRQGGVQMLSLGSGCYDRGTIVHELMHAAGFFHEHTRSDRDQFVDVFLENVATGQEHNFKKLEPSKNRLITAFDKQSIMLYGSASFSRAPGLATMLTKDGKRLAEVHEKKGLSPSDVRRIQILYKCRK